MNIKLSFTPFRNIFRHLSIYSERSRGEGIAAKVKWDFNKDVQIYGYDSPNHQTKLSVVRLNSNKFENFDKNHTSFLTEVPTVRGLGTVVGQNKIKIDTGSEQDNLKVSTENFRYNIKKGWKAQKMDIKNYYLPMDQIKFRTSVSSNNLKNFLYLTEKGPIEINSYGRFSEITAKTDTEKVSLDLDDNIDTYSDSQRSKHLYDRFVMLEAIKKFPSNKNVEIVVNDDLIRLRCQIDNNLGCIDYYQRGRVSR